MKRYRCLCTIGRRLLFFLCQNLLYNVIGCSLNCNYRCIFTCNNINAYVGFTVVVVIGITFVIIIIKFRNRFGLRIPTDCTGISLYTFGFCRCFCCNLTFIPYMSCCRNFFFLCVSADGTSVNFYARFGTGCFFFDCSVIPCMLCVFFMYIIVSCLFPLQCCHHQLSGTCVRLYLCFKVWCCVQGVAAVWKTFYQFSSVLN